VYLSVFDLIYSCVEILILKMQNIDQVINKWRSIYAIVTIASSTKIRNKTRRLNKWGNRLLSLFAVTFFRFVFSQVKVNYSYEKSEIFNSIFNNAI
jgi:hypothetical protein